MPRKRSFSGRRLNKIGARRAYGGAFGTRARSPGTHQLARGFRTNAYGQKMLVFDRGVILRRPVSIQLGEALLKSFLSETADRARRYFQTHKAGLKLLPELAVKEPIVSAGCVTVDRGRMFQPWGGAEGTPSMLDRVLLETVKQAARYGVDTLARLPSEDPDADADEDDAQAEARIARGKTGIIGYFVRCRSVSLTPLPPPKPRKTKRKTTRKAARKKGRK